MTADLFTTQVTSSALVVFLIQRLKAAKWFPLLQNGKKWASRIAAAIGAAATALAVQYTWNPQTRVIAIAIPTLPVFALALWHWINHVAMQEMIYQVTANKHNGQ